MTRSPPKDKAKGALVSSISTTQLFYREVSTVGRKLQAAKTIKDYLRLLKGIEEEVNALVQLNDAHLRLMASKTVLAQPGSDSRTARLLQRAWAPVTEPRSRVPTVARLLSSDYGKPVPRQTQTTASGGVTSSFTDRLLRDLSITSGSIDKSEALFASWDEDDEESVLEAALGESDSVAPLTSSVTLVLQDKDVYVPAGSPAGKGADRPTFAKIPTTEELSKNYSVVVELHEKSRSLDEIASSLDIQFSGNRGTDKTTDKAAVQKIHKEIQNLRTQVDRALAKAAMYLTEVANAHAPPKFVILTKALATMLERAMTYKSVQSYLYVFPNEHESTDKGTAFSFCHYFWLKGLTDSDGKIFPQLFVVLSCTPSPATGMNFRLNTLTDMVPPSPKMLGKKFEYTKPGDAPNLARTLGNQLDIDKVANVFGRIPISTLLKKETLTKDRFSVEQSVHELKVDSKSITFTFVDAVNTEEKASKLAAQLAIELQAWARSTKARLRQKVSQATNGSWSANFYYLRPVGFAITHDDLEFMKERWDLDDRTLDNIVDTINKS